MIVLRPQYEGEEDSFRQLPLTGDSNEMVPPYYPGTEIDGYMPHRGDFAVVSPRHPTIGLISIEEYSGTTGTLGEVSMSFRDFSVPSILT